MHRHFNEGINVEGLLREAAPRLVVELGAALGANTKLLAPLCKELGARLVVISDGEDVGVDGAEWWQGVSYLKLWEFDDESIDVALVDTDHNSWTVTQELYMLSKKLRQGGLAILHDTIAFVYANGTMLKYGVDVEYPLEEIVKDHRFYREAVLMMTGTGRPFLFAKESPASNGALALRRK